MSVPLEFDNCAFKSYLKMSYSRDITAYVLNYRKYKLTPYNITGCVNN